MQNRKELKQSFLKLNNVNIIGSVEFPPDASFRRYERLFFEDNSSQILMDSPPEKERIEEFIKVDHFLRSININAPEIYCVDAQHGFMIIEDFGDLSFRKYLDDNPLDEWELYKRATDVLIKIHRAEPPVMPSYNLDLFVNEAMIFIDYSIAPAIRDINKVQQLKAEFKEILTNIFNDLPTNFNNVFVLRDYHADNLHYLPNRYGTDSVGLLDFQDAVIGTPVYDILSLIEDARRKVSDFTVHKVIEYYLNEMNYDPEEFMVLYHTWAAQRNLKIMGIFNRKFFRDGTPKYLQLLPRVMVYLMGNLTYPNLFKLREFINMLLVLQETSHHKSF